ncbi:RES family NAD+ phosphorylase [Fibrella sp. HMF5335]|uniref:RES family NAD+ phosphorylase n=1 Tax=Fibrella rubiginis TaxID=2817060 RepID=A0A939GD16_9BACT|nr:RES family NAD+ phosphorylase [Fibrella rubiginis]MBO0936852.1 RES family NAD+ phosphorylase [Fibrella rubiginis]
MDVYRINKEPWHTDPLSVVGSHKFGGRWNPKGTGILYTSRTPELALLETLVHLPPITLAELPQLWLSTIRLPDDVPDAVFWLDPTLMPAHWKSSSTLADTPFILNEWIQQPFCLALGVPSVILNMSYNLLLNPLHPAFAHVKVMSQVAIQIDARLW